MATKPTKQIDPIEVAANDVLAVFGEHTKDIIEDTAQLTFEGGVDAYIDSLESGGAEASIHNEMTFAAVARAVAPKLIAAAEAAESRAADQRGF